MKKKYVIGIMLCFFTIVGTACSTSVQNSKNEVSSNTKSKYDDSQKTFGITAESFRQQINERMSKTTNERLAPFQVFDIQKNKFKVDDISQRNIILEGTVAPNGELSSITYKSRMVDDESLIKTMALVDLTAKVLPPNMDEKKKGDLLEDVIEASVASPKSFAQKTVNNSVIYTVESLPDGQFIVTYTPATMS
ncbi:hypothetical protein P256_01644 [Acinetobacter nectaris CIP 110549]|uniref:Lipoprotein n=1 Tax=Acinetobacter nectaris CIP 110549 TaxID=1392540 RepID=V2TRX8_9GAMM|nr:hypothetical protein [Acinetobacter nectaris]ESK38825.1 hypothetical protein P256_01644 [Acinetobacter nectaris CIP 110549]